MKKLFFFLILLSTSVQATEFDSSCHPQAPFTLCDQYILIFYEYKDLVSRWNELANDYNELVFTAAYMEEAIRIQKLRIKKLKAQLRTERER